MKFSVTPTMLAIAYTFIMLGVTGCSESTSKNLTRELVRAKLVASGHFPVERTIDLPLRIQIRDIGILPLYQRVESTGAIKLTKVNQPYQVWPIYDISITEVGAKFKAQNQNGAEKNTVAVVACTIDLGEVTGIEQSADKTKAAVYFDLVSKGPTPFAQLDVNGNGLCSRPIRKATTKAPHIAKMSLFDDGWRIVDVAQAEPLHQ